MCKVINWGVVVPSWSIGGGSTHPRISNGVNFRSNFLHQRSFYLQSIVVGVAPPSRLSHIFLSTAAHCLGHLSKLWPRPRQAYRYSYDYPSRKWDRSVVVVSIESTHFSEGNLRRCFRMKDLTKPDGENDFVAKASKDKNDDIEVPGHPATQSLFGHLVNFNASGSGRRGKGRYFSWHPSVHSSPMFFAKHQDGLATGLLIKEGCNWGGGRQMQII